MLFIYLLYIKYLYIFTPISLETASGIAERVETRRDEIFAFRAERTFTAGIAQINPEDAIESQS